MNIILLPQDSFALGVDVPPCWRDTLEGAPAFLSASNRGALQVDGESAYSFTVTLPRSEKVGCHIERVLRARVGDTLSIGMIHGPRGSAKVTCYEDTSIILEGSFTYGGDHPNPMVLVVGYSRPICMKRILRDSAMLGVEELWVHVTELGEKSYQTASLWRDNKFLDLLYDGASQAGGTYIPTVRFFQSTQDMLQKRDELFPTYQSILCDTEEGAKPFLQLWDNHGSFVCVGSERGWSRGERNLFSRMGFSVASLGERILRTETACTLVLGASSL